MDCGSQCAHAPNFASRHHSGVCVKPAHRLPVGGIRTVGHRQRRQVPNVRRQAQVSVADDYPINVHRGIVGRQTDGQRGLGGNRNVNDRIEKRIGQRPRRMHVDFAGRLVVDSDTDRAHFDGRIANCQFARSRQAGELDALAGICQTGQSTLPKPNRQPPWTPRRRVRRLPASNVCFSAERAEVEAQSNSK